MLNETYSNGTYFCELPENRTGVVAVTVFGVLCIVWIITSNTLTLVTVCLTKIKQQKKQLVLLLVAALYNAVIGLPSTFLQFYKIEILYNERWCLLSMGVADFGLLFFTVSITLVMCTTYLTLKYPLRCHIFQSSENTIIIFQIAFPALYMALLMIVNFFLEPAGMKCCFWPHQPDWYFYSYFPVFFLMLTAGYSLAVAILCIAKRQATQITTIAMSREDRNKADRSRNRNAKHAKFIKITVFAFLLTWIPIILTTLLDSSVEGITIDDVTFYLIYFTVITISSSLPVIYSYAFADVRSQLKILFNKAKR